MVKESRFGWVDLVKGIAILWLVVYHFYAVGWLRSPVPVFFFLSGLFYSDGKSFGSFLTKKAKALLIPLLFFFVLGVIAMAVKAIFVGEAISFPPLWRFCTLIPANAEVTNPLGVGAIWFLVSLFEIYVLYYLFRRVSKNKYWLFTTAVLLFLLSSITMQKYGMGSWLYLFYTSGFYIYFVIADMLREKVLYEKITMKVFIIFIAAYFLRLFDFSSVMNDNLMGGILLRVRDVMSMLGVIGILAFVGKMLENNNMACKSKLYLFFLFEGRNSITILGVHLLAMGIITILMKQDCIVNNLILYYIMSFFVIVLICNVCIFLFNRYLPFFVNHK